MKEKEIIELLKSGEIEKAFQRLYKIYPQVRSLLKKYGAGTDQCQDIFQDALVVLYRKFTETGLPETFLMEAYLVNTCKYMWLKLKRNPSENVEWVEVVQDEPELERLLAEDKKVQQAETALMQIGEKCREILIRFYVQKKTMADIARSFSMVSEEAAKMQKFRCLTAAQKIYHQLIHS